MSLGHVDKETSDDIVKGTLVDDFGGEAGMQVNYFFFHDMTNFLIDSLILDIFSLMLAGGGSAGRRQVGAYR